MRRPSIMVTCLGMLALGAGAAAAEAGDSIYGTVTAVRRADLVVLDYGTGSREVHIVGIILPRDRRIASEARALVEELVLRKHARIHIEGLRDGRLYAQLLTADTTVGINRDVAVELVRRGLARQQPGFDYKYRELSVAQNEAVGAQRGLWAYLRNR